MKHFLRTFFLLTLVGYSYVVNAQTGACGASDIIVQNVRNISGCIYQFDVAFTLSGSNGNKYVFFQTYTQNAYSSYFQCDQATNTSDVKKPPEEGDFTATPILNVAIDVSGPTPVYTIYTPDPDVDTLGYVPPSPSNPNLTPSEVDTVQINGGDDVRYILRNLVVELPNCNTPQILVTDIFATNARSANQVQCVTCGLRFASGFFRIGTLSVEECDPARLIGTLINNTGTQITGTYTVYADINNNASLTTESGIDIVVIPTTQLIIPASGEVLINQEITATGYNGQNLFLVVDQNISGGVVPTTARTVIFIDRFIACGALPVKIKSFTATRKSQNVELLWETASEDNNRGFYVQRNDGGGWKDLGFVATKAQGGNSTSDLSYTYTDLNNTARGITQYRIMQVDIDGKSKLSDVRQVRGLDQAGKVTVYPNPSIDGKVNVVFDDSKAAWNVSVSDMNGRTIKQYKGVTNSVVIDNLLPGMYMIRIVDVQTGVQTNEKVIINNR